MDGFATSHMLCETLLPEPDLLREFIGDPEGRIPSPTVAQEMLFGAKGRVFTLKTYLGRCRGDIPPGDLANLIGYVDSLEAEIERDNEGQLISSTLAWVPAELRGQWRRQWLNAPEKGTRKRVPALVDVDDPGMTGGVQNQADFQAGVADHRTHFAADVPRFVRDAMEEYGALTGRNYAPVQTFACEDADDVLVGLGSVTEDAEAVAGYLRSQGKKVGVLSIKLLHPFPEAEVVAALAGKRAVTVLERSDATVLSGLVTHALFKAMENAARVRHAGIPAIERLPRITTAIFGLGAHDLQPRHLIAACANMEREDGAPFVYLGTRFFDEEASPRIAALQDRLRAAYPQTQFMALPSEPNPHLLPADALRIRFHSVGGYGTVATGKLLTDILAGALGLHSKSAPKYGSEKSGAPTNFYITLSPEPVKITNAELEEIEIAVSPDHKVFSHTNPLAGLAPGGTFIMQSSHEPLDVWQQLPAHARRTIRERRINFYVVDAFAVAKKHAPTPELEVRMMGIAFIGAVCGHVDRIVADASEEAMLVKIRQQIAKKFGAKGRGVVDSNMAVIREGLEATLKIDYSDPAFELFEREETIDLISGTAASAAMAAASGSTQSCGLFDPGYYEDAVASRFKDGTIGEAPVLPGAGLFMPPGCAAQKDKGLFRLTVPEFDPNLCTGCMECALVCPDAAIPNAVHEIHDLLLGGINALDATAQQKDLLRTHVFTLASAVRERYRTLASKEPAGFAQIVAEAAAAIDTDDLMLRRNLDRLAEALAIYPVAKARPFFDAMEKAAPGSGGLFAAAVDPWKCSGCLECIEVCGPGALSARKQDAEFGAVLERRFAFLSALPNTPARFHDNATRTDGDAKRLLLDRSSYYAMTGGHGACRGCGEVTAIRFITSANRAIAQKQRKEHVRELSALVDRLNAKLERIQPDDRDPQRRRRMQQTIDRIERRLYRFESGPTGNGPAGAAIVNATGCSSVYASTFPSNPYTDPWVNSLFQDSPAVAKGVFEGLCVEAAEDFKALRTAKLELEDHYDPQVHDRFFTFFGWPQFTAEERELMPIVLAIGGDGATYDIGFGALSRLLTTATPVKIVVLNTGAYSNTGGQTSTASFPSQDSDLSRIGAAHVGKAESRKELGLIAAFHPNVLVVQTATALQSHFLRNVIDLLTYNDSPAVLDIYTPCQAEHGIADDAANRRARLAVESRMNPVFVHDPRAGATLHERFSLGGNPDLESDWTTATIEYVGEDGTVALLEAPLTPADFAVRETRFAKHFAPLAAGAQGVPVHEYVELDADDRYGKTPFIWATGEARELTKLAVSAAIVELVVERRRNWRTLQYLAGLHVERLQQAHLEELASWQQRYAESAKERELSIDTIARAMSELAAVSSAPSPAEPALPTIPLPSVAATNGRGGDGIALRPLVSIDDDDMIKCTNCKTCYQNLGELFEKTKIVCNGTTKEVARVIPGVLDRIEITPELIKRASRIAADCDAEIIR
jgi:pyruvate-ferredoxin/flavodoxin oxidoreductase